VSAAEEGLMSTDGDIPRPGAGVVTEVDVRPVIAAGDPPFRMIMNAVEDLAPGAVLRVRSPFDPKPLHGILEGLGFSRRVRRGGEDDWQSDYWRPDADAPLVLDVRGLVPPEPLERTLATLDALSDGRALLQVNDRVPAFLLPLLDERGYRYRIDHDQRGTLTTIWRGAA
jgi:uncharacterized protein (DUF2249 family)